MAGGKEGLDERIVRQVEFYFGDSNLGKDRFMKHEIDQAKDGWIPVAVIGNFNKMKVLTTDTDRILRALKNSTLVEVSKEKKAIRRRVPFVQPANVDDRTIYAENLPPGCDHDMLQKIFAQYGDVTYVSLPRFENRVIKGFAFIEFATPDEAQTAANSKTVHKSADNAVTTELSVMTKHKWLEMKEAYKKMLKQAQAEQKKKKPSQTPKTPTNHAREQPAAPTREGVIVRMENFNPNTKKSSVKDALSKYGKIAYVDYNKGKVTAFVRLPTHDDATSFVSAFQSSPDLQATPDVPVKPVILSDAEHTEYWRHAQRTAPSTAHQPNTQHTPRQHANGDGSKVPSEQAPVSKKKKKSKKGPGHTRFAEEESSNEAQQPQEEKSEGNQQTAPPETPAQAQAKENTEKQQTGIKRAGAAEQNTTAKRRRVDVEASAVETGKKEKVEEKGKTTPTQTPKKGARGVVGGGSKTRGKKRQLDEEGANENENGNENGKGKGKGKDEIATPAVKRLHSEAKKSTKKKTQTPAQTQNTAQKRRKDEDGEGGGTPGTTRVKRARLNVVESSAVKRKAGEEEEGEGQAREERVTETPGKEKKE